MQQAFNASWESLHAASGLPGLAAYEEDEFDERQIITEALDNIQRTITDDAEKGNKLESILAVHLGGYQKRAKMLRGKIVEASEALEEERIKLDCLQTLQIAEQAALPRRLESLQDEVAFVKKREKEAQESYRAIMGELDALRNGKGSVNGVH